MPPLDILATLALAHPAKPAVIDDRPDGTVIESDFEAFNREVNRLANVLLSLGVKRGEKVVWCGMNSIGLVRMIHATRKAGTGAVPLNYRLTAEEAGYVIDNCDAAVVYADADVAELMSEVAPRCSKVREWLIFDGPAPQGMTAIDPLLADAGDAEPRAAGDGELPPVTITYTSGTTGKPKGAVRRGMGDPNQVAKMVALIGYVPDDVYLTTGPLYHSGPGGFMGLAHAMGNTVIVQRKYAAEDWLRLVEKYRVTTTFSAPTPIRLVCKLPAEVKSRYDTTSMRRMIANAAPWSFALKQAYLADFPEDSLWEVYGSTELGVNAILSPEDQRTKRGSCGKPAPMVELLLFDENGNVIEKPHTPGELFARSKTVFDTYYKAQDKYEADRRGEYHTVGDMAYFDEDGYFYICDRKKDMIISGGMNIYPAEIEAALELHEHIADVAVFGIPSDDWGESVHAVIVCSAGVELTSEAVIEFSREHLAGYKVPRSVEFRAEIPRTGSGKILKRVLREPWWKDHESQVL